MSGKLKIAIVHDFLNYYGGAEYVVTVLHELFPAAPIYTSIYKPEHLGNKLPKARIIFSWLQKIPFIDRLYKWLFFLYPFAFASFDLSAYDLIISSSSAFAKNIRIKPWQEHLCYCHTPPRFLYRAGEYVHREKIASWLKRILPPFLAALAWEDLRENKNITHFIANSENIQRRIKNIYQRPAHVIYPPVAVHKYDPRHQRGDYFLILSRLVGYKRLDLAVLACNKLCKKLIVIGEGPAHKYLRSIAGPTITFLGRQSDRAVKHYVENCQALIFPGEEDFGITPVEAQAAGKPVIALRAGGALETVKENETGLFFEKQTVPALVKAIRKFYRQQWDPFKIRRNALRFSKEHFKRELKQVVNNIAKIRKVKEYKDYKNIFEDKALRPKDLSWFELINKYQKIINK